MAVAVAPPALAGGWLTIDGLTNPDARIRDGRFPLLKASWSESGATDRGGFGGRRVPGTFDVTVPLSEAIHAARDASSSGKPYPTAVIQWDNAGLSTMQVKLLQVKIAGVAVDYQQGEPTMTLGLSYGQIEWQRADASRPSVNSGPSMINRPVTNPNVARIAAPVAASSSVRIVNVAALPRGGVVDCPIAIAPQATVSVSDHPQPVRYRWLYSEGAAKPIREGTVTPQAALHLTDTWSVGSAGRQVVGWAQLEIESSQQPQASSLKSGQIRIDLRCR